MNKQYQSKSLFILGIIAVLILVGFAYYFFVDNDDVSINTNTYISDVPGPTSVQCSTNNDCIDICKDDGCLVSSCVKNQDKEMGTCACFDLCTI